MNQSCKNGYCAGSCPLTNNKAKHGFSSDAFTKTSKAQVDSTSPKSEKMYDP